MAVGLGLLSWFGWLQVQAQHVQWAIERVGGNTVLEDTRPQPDDDEQRFLEALSLNPTPSVRERVLNPEICRSMDEHCALVNLGMLNFMMLDMPGKFSTLGTLDAYINHWKSQGGKGCPAVEEISALVRASSQALTLQGDERARSAQQAFTQFQAPGGVLGVLDSAECKTYFVNKPFMARAYLAHLGYLLALAQGKHSAQAAYLTSLPAVLSILK
ncbi:hypothetical protein EXN22_05055 [Pseudomonas tructae]|uniref:Uncharacterized protein n=1 Tax=Pseudomonas tructae TaxID=2518644 RepID=A0A411ME74_9PSED|nr:hypothetical protein [Pseudomonas tructae]QBF25086.1 hypothetical protein EXN22_05055 [Pseudomonas tructae]